MTSSPSFIPNSMAFFTSGEKEAKSNGLPGTIQIVAKLSRAADHAERSDGTAEGN